MKTFVISMLFILLNIGVIPAQSRITCSQAYYTTDDAVVTYLQYDSDYYGPVSSTPHPNDASIESSIWTYNYGNAGAGIKRFYINFDLSDFNSTTNSQILNTDLYLFGSGNGSGYIVCNASDRSNKHILHRVLEVWNENTLTWNNQPPNDGTTSVITPEIMGTMTTPNCFFDAVYNLNDILLNGNYLYPDYHGIMCQPYAENLFEYYRRMAIATKENSIPSRHPYLKVQYDMPKPTIVFNSETHTFYVINNSDLEILFNNVQYNWTINGTNYTGDIVVPAESSSYDVHLQLIITNNIGETCEFSLENCDTGNIVLNKTICENDSYNFYGTILTESGAYIDTISSVTGCDSIITLNLTVNSLNQKTVNAVICTDDSYDFYGTILTEPGTYTDTISSVTGCDTIVTLNLSVDNECNKMYIDSLGEICADDDKIIVDYTVTRGTLISYSAVFDSKSVEAGFSNIPITPAFGSSIEFPIPMNVRPNNYSVIIIFNFDNGSSIEFTENFQILYSSSIIIQRWNDVLALLNEHFNGGYIWSDYQWYKNDIPIPNEQSSYIYVGVKGEVLDTTAYYRAKVTRIDDGVTLFTCEYFPIYNQNANLTIRPTLALQNQPITIIFAGGKSVTIWNVMGIQIAQYQLSGITNSINAPTISGTYILKIENISGEQTTAKIIVQ
ncbi:MAG: DNRLRE domain-containing protein [Paludibacter sp.]|nr:DNRLRE domain-containing protein [Paludibacter sp.]